MTKLKIVLNDRPGVEWDECSQNLGGMICMGCCVEDNSENTGQTTSRIDSKRDALFYSQIRYDTLPRSNRFI